MAEVTDFIPITDESNKRKAEDDSAPNKEKVIKTELEKEIATDENKSTLTEDESENNVDKEAEPKVNDNEAGPFNNNAKEVEIKEEAIEVEDDDDCRVVRPVVVMDGPSVGRSRTLVGLGLEYKVEAAISCFIRQGCEVVVFFPKRFAKKLQGLGEEARSCLKLTLADKPCTGDNPWGLDKLAVVRHAVDRRATLVTNDSYRYFTFEGPEFEEQIKERLMGFKWQEGEFVPARAEVWKGYPYLPSVAWQRAKAPVVTERQQRILEMEARADLVPYERERLRNMKELEAKEKEKRQL